MREVRKSVRKMLKMLKSGSKAVKRMTTGVCKHTNEDKARVWFRSAAQIYRYIYGNCMCVCVDVTRGSIHVYIIWLSGCVDFTACGSLYCAKISLAYFKAADSTYSKQLPKKKHNIYIYKQQKIWLGMKRVWKKNATSIGREKKIRRASWLVEVSTCAKEAEKEAANFTNELNLAHAMHIT